MAGLADHLLAGATANPAGEIAAADGSQSFCFSELAEQAARGAAGLRANGIGRGDVVALHLPNIPQYASALLAVLPTGAAAAMCSPVATEDELATQLALTRPTLVLTTPARESIARAASQRAGAGPATSSLPTANSSAPEPEPIQASDPALIAFSSGTTGTPKAAVLTNGGLLNNLRQAAEGLPLASDDVLLALAPFAHVMGLCGLLMRGLAAGATIVTLERFDPQIFLDVLARHRVTQTIIPPPLIDLLATSPAVEQHDLSALRVLYVGGAGTDASTERACSERLGCTVAQGYGMTEGGPMIAVNPAGDIARIRHGSAGLPLRDVQLRVVDPATGTVLDAGHTGEIQVCSPAVMARYHKDPQATARTIGKDGWLHTGDLGHVDSDGYLWITDRLKDIIKHKGHQVAPAELEAVLTTHPAIIDAAVIGAPDPRTGEIPVGFVTLRSPTDLDTLIAYVAKRVSPHKRLHAIRAVPEIPRTPTGKILRRELRELWRCEA